MALTGVNSQPKIHADAAPTRALKADEASVQTSVRGEVARAEARVEAPAVETARNPDVARTPEAAPKTVAEKAEKAAVELEKALSALSDLISSLGGGKQDLGYSGDTEQSGLENTSFSSLLNLDGGSNFEPPAAVAPPSTSFLEARGGGGGPGDKKSGGGARNMPGGYGD
jgi:hypothetical protein